VHRLKSSIKIIGTHNRDFVLRQMLLFPVIRAVSGSEFFWFSAGQCPSTSRQRHSSVSASRCLILSHPLSGSLTLLVTTSCEVCFRSESMVPRSQNWNDASTASGPLSVTRLLNVLFASGVSVYAFVFVLEADIFLHTL